MGLLESFQPLFNSVLNTLGVNVIITLVTISIIAWYTYSSAPKNLPPGPIGLPIVGYLPFLGKKPHETLNELAKKYGPVFSLYFGNRLVVVLNTYDAIKEAFIKQGEVFSGRPPLQLTVADTDTYGIAVADGEKWKIHRRFALNVLRDLGVGKMSIEPLIKEEIQYFLTELKKIRCQTTDFSEQLTASVANNICILIFGKRFVYNDPWFVEAKKIINEVAVASNSAGIMNFFPWLRKLPGIEKILNQETIIKHINEFKEHDYRRIKEAKDNYSDDKRDNYINAFIGEQKSREKKEKDEMFSDRALEENVRVLMAAGTETTATTLQWCILYMAKHPEVQAKVQKEIDDAIGMERVPCWDDRLRTPFTEATINEVQRIATLIPTNLPHKNNKDCQLFGYHIPKNTFIISNLWAVHNDKHLWENPQLFKPERFLDENGEFKASKKEHVIPFSMGKRECLGISLAKMELYLYFASLLQKFTFRSPEGSTPSLEPRIGLTIAPKYFRVHAIIRDKA